MHVAMHVRAMHHLPGVIVCDFEKMVFPGEQMECRVIAVFLIIWLLTGHDWKVWRRPSAGYGRSDVHCHTQLLSSASTTDDPVGRIHRCDSSVEGALDVTCIKCFSPMMFVTCFVLFYPIDWNICGS